MHIRPVALIFAAAIVVTACSERSAPDGANNANAPATPPDPMRASEVESTKGEAALPPPSDRQISKDCVAFLRSTKVVPAQAARSDCPECPVGGSDVLSFRQVKTDATSCSGDTCTIVVTIRAMFNPASGETIAGGLTAWIPPERRSAYLAGETPSDEQVYRVQITYKRRGEAWRAVEFERAPGG